MVRERARWRRQDWKDEGAAEHAIYHRGLSNATALLAHISTGFSTQMKAVLIGSLQVYPKPRGMAIPGMGAERGSPPNAFVLEVAAGGYKHVSHRSKAKGCTIRS
eukprot:SAG11_NODE_2091_length_3842_cov_1.651349_3_plen_105_part_00